MAQTENIVQFQLEKRANGLQKWLDKNGNNCQKQQGHLLEASIERVYWHYGYMVALMDVLRLLANTKIREN